MNSVVKIEYKVTAYVAVCNTSELDDNSIIARAVDVISGIPEKDFDWTRDSVKITSTDEEFKDDYCISECRFNQILSRK